MISQTVTGWALYAYVEGAGVDAGVAGSIRTAHGLWVALLAPLVGVWSDRSRAASGSRRRWLGIALPVLLSSFVLLFVAPGHAPVATLLPLFGVLLWVHDTASLVLWVGASALLNEAFPDLGTRATAAALRQAGIFGGMVIGIGLGPIAIGALGFPMLSLLYAVIGGGMLGGMILRQSSGIEPRRDDTSASRPTSLREALGATLRDRDFWHFALPSFLTQAASSIQAACLPFFARYTLGLDRQGSAVVLTTVLVGAMPAGLGWARVLRRLGPTLTWPLVLGTFGLCSFFARFPHGLGPSIPAGLGISVAVSGLLVLSDVKLATIIDRGEASASQAGSRREGSRGSRSSRAGNYQGVYMVLVRLAAAGQGLGFLFISAHFGYQGGTDPGPDPGGAFRFLVAELPAALGMIALGVHLIGERLRSREAPSPAP